MTLLEKLNKLTSLDWLEDLKTGDYYLTASDSAYTYTVEDTGSVFKLTHSDLFAEHPGNVHVTEIELISAINTLVHSNAINEPFPRAVPNDLRFYCSVSKLVAELNQSNSECRILKPSLTLHMDSLIVMYETQIMRAQGCRETRNTGGLEIRDVKWFADPQKKTPSAKLALIGTRETKATK